MSFRQAAHAHTSLRFATSATKAAPFASVFRTAAHTAHPFAQITGWALEVEHAAATFHVLLASFETRALLALVASRTLVVPDAESVRQMPR